VSPNTLLQEKLNEAVMVLNKSLQVGRLTSTVTCSHRANDTSGDQCAEHERRARSADVQELPIERAVPPGRSVDPLTAIVHSHMALRTCRSGKLLTSPTATDSLKDPA
jgi:hypothetical protein